MIDWKNGYVYMLTSKLNRFTTLQIFLQFSYVTAQPSCFLQAAFVNQLDFAITLSTFNNMRFRHMPVGQALVLAKNQCLSFDLSNAF